MSTHRKTSNFLSLYEGSPCIKCLVRASCTKSFISKSACNEYAQFIQDLLFDKDGNVKYENKD